MAQGRTDSPPAIAVDEVVEMAVGASVQPAALAEVDWLYLAGGGETNLYW